MKLWFRLHVLSALLSPYVMFCARCTLSGRIKAIQLEYSEARRTLTNALRKAPQHTAVGFKQTVSVALCVPGCWCWAVSECRLCPSGA